MRDAGSPLHSRPHLDASLRICACGTCGCITLEKRPSLGPNFARLLKLSGAASKRPKLALMMLLAVVCVGALGLLRLELRTDGHALVPQQDPVVVFDRELREEFPLLDPIIIYLDTGHADGIFDLEFLSRVRDLTMALAALPEFGGQQIMSLAVEARPRVYPGTLKFRPLLDPMPDTPQRMEWLREDLEEIRILDGVLVSADRSGTAIIVGAPPSASSHKDGVNRRVLYQKIKKLIFPIGEYGSKRAAGAEHESESSGRSGNPAVHVSIVGAPIAEALLGAHILEDLQMMVPLALLLISSVIWIFCRRAFGVMIVVGEAGVCLLFTFGVMGWFGIPIYLTTAVLPVILTSIGIADELHILSHFQREVTRTASGDRRQRDDEAVARTMEAMVRPVTITSLTTGLGFLSFLVAPIVPVVSFGGFAALGIAFCWLWSLVAMPALLSLLGSKWLGRHSYRHSDLLRIWIAQANVGFRALIERPGRTLMGFLGITLLLCVGTFGLQVQDSWIDGFATGSRLRVETERVDSALHGTHVLLAHISLPERPGKWPMTRKREGPMLVPGVLRAIGHFEDGLREIPGVGGVLGPASHLRSANHLFMAGQQGSRSIPNEPHQVASVLDSFEMARGIQRRREVFHDDMHRGVVTLLVKNANFRDTARIMERARQLEAEHLAPLGARLDFGGDLAVSQAMIPAIVKTQLGSLLLALMAATLTVACLSGSLREAVLAIAPTAVAMLWLFGAMGYLGISIGVATSTFCAITLGIGVDYAVHLLERFRRMGLQFGASLGAESESRQKTGARAVRLAVGEAAPAIVADATAVALGFGMLSFSQVPANASLGIVVAVALLASAVLSLVGLSAFRVWREAG